MKAKKHLQGNEEGCNLINPQIYLAPQILGRGIEERRSSPKMSKDDYEANFYCNSIMKNETYKELDQKQIESPLLFSQKFKEQIQNAKGQSKGHFA